MHVTDFSWNPRTLLVNRESFKRQLNEIYWYIFYCACSLNNRLSWNFTIISLDHTEFITQDSKKHHPFVKSPLHAAIFNKNLHWIETVNLDVSRKASWFSHWSKCVCQTDSLTRQIESTCWQNPFKWYFSAVYKSIRTGTEHKRNCLLSSLYK